MGFPTTRARAFADDHGVMKKLLLISLAVTAILVLALGGWAVKPFRRSPAYA